MTWQVFHLDALEAQLKIALAQVALARADAAGSAVPRAMMDALPETCAGVPADKCARQNPDARIDVAGMGGAAPVWVCRGCGERLE